MQGYWNNTHIWTTATHRGDTVTTKPALKFDNGKPDLSLIPRAALDQCARAFMLGEQKYGRYNFYNGMEASRLVAACLRHVTAWNEGEETDPESGASHLGHALACISMILQQQHLGTLKDNRYTKVSPANVDKLSVMIDEKRGIG
jgi:hypothetical protein